MAAGESVIYVRLPRGKTKVRREVKALAGQHDKTVSEVAVVAMEHFLSLSKDRQKKLLG